MNIPLGRTKSAGDGRQPSSADLYLLLEKLGLAEHAADIKIYEHAMSEEQRGRSSEALSASQSKISISQIVHEWALSFQDEERFDTQEASSNGSLTSNMLSSTYMIYPPLLLLPANTFSQWPSEFMRSTFPAHSQLLYRLLCSKFSVTHIALNGPISPSISSSYTHLNGANSKQADTNILRTPTNLTPLYGDFGPLLPTTHQPSPSDFAQAFWCTARQNKIFQTWAPRYTMFSRGNISEKARILQLDTLKAARLGCPPEETSAVDLYSGIGYFSFSYAKAGVGRVLCWEINPWSVEGLRRGAKENGWNAGDWRDIGGAESEEIEGNRLLVFEESNEHAGKAVAALRKRIPPVRHVNCGFLPSSQDSWKTAVEILDPVFGGWIHAHENIAKKDIEIRTSEVVESFEGLVSELYGPVYGIQRIVRCEHVGRVKSYAPGVIHCVFDIAITPSRPSI